LVAACLALAACGSETLRESDAGAGAGGTNVGAGGAAGAIGVAGASGTTGLGGSAGGGGPTGGGGASGTGGAAGGGAAGATGTGGTLGAGGSGGIPGGCNSLVNAAPVVAKFQAATNPPAPGGGPIVDGTYYLSQAITYTGPGGASGPLGSTIQDTLVITNAASGTATVQEVTSGDGGADAHASFTLTPAGTMATVTITCPSPSISVSFGYTATATTFMVVSGDQASFYIRH
jgi:hypothetical protein